MSTKQTEALKLALEALKMCRALIRINIERLVPIESPNPWFSQDVDHAITAIREALDEQPAKCKHNVFSPYRCTQCEAEQPAQQDWQPIETAPKDGTMFMACLRFIDVSYPVQWVRGEWQMAWDNTTLDEHSITGWMPIPAAPQPQGEKK